MFMPGCFFSYLLNLMGKQYKAHACFKQARKIRDPHDDLSSQLRQQLPLTCPQLSTVVMTSYFIATLPHIYASIFLVSFVRSLSFASPIHFVAAISTQNSILPYPISNYLIQLHTYIPKGRARAREKVKWSQLKFVCYAGINYQVYN